MAKVKRRQDRERNRVLKQISNQAYNRNYMKSVLATMTPELVRKPTFLEKIKDKFTSKRKAGR